MFSLCRYQHFHRWKQHFVLNKPLKVDKQTTTSSCEMILLLCFQSETSYIFAVIFPAESTDPHQHCPVCYVHFPFLLDSRLFFLHLTNFYKRFFIISLEQNVG